MHKSPIRPIGDLCFFFWGDFNFKGAWWGGFAPQGEFRFFRNVLVPPTRGRLAAASGLRALRGGCSPPLRTPLVSFAFMGEVTGFQRSSFRGQILCVWSFFEILRVCKPGSVFHCDRLVAVSVCSIATLLQSEIPETKTGAFQWNECV